MSLLLNLALLSTSCAMDERAQVLRLKNCDEGRCARGFACVDGTCMPDPGTGDQSVALQQVTANSTEAEVSSEIPEAIDAGAARSEDSAEPTALPESAEEGGASE